MAYERHELDSIALVTNFFHFAENQRLPRELFIHPDHIALHATDIQDFGGRVREILPKSEQVSVVQRDDRFIATAKLAGALGVVNLGSVRWLEIMEPIKEEQQVGVAGSEHVEFFYDEIEKARSILGALGVKHIIDDHPAPIIKVPFSKHGDEFRLTRVPIEDIVARDIYVREAVIVQKAA